MSLLFALFIAVCASARIPLPSVDDILKGNYNVGPIIIKENGAEVTRYLVCKNFMYKYILHFTSEY